jgi:hypothetical protein
MKTRPYDPERDYEYVYNALLSEGLRPKEMSFKDDNVIITEVGFFSYIKEHNLRYPFLHHFYVNINQRSLKNFLRLVRELKQTMSSTGYSMFIAQQPRGKAFLGKFIKFAKGVKAFKKEGHTYYLVPASLKVGTRKGKKA